MTRKIAVFDSIDRGLSQYATEDQISYLETKDDIMLWLAETEEICRTREAMYLEAVKQGEIANLDFHRWSLSSTDFHGSSRRSTHLFRIKWRCL